MEGSWCLLFYRQSLSTRSWRVWRKRSSHVWIVRYFGSKVEDRPFHLRWRFQGWKGLRQTRRPKIESRPSTLPSLSDQETRELTRTRVKEPKRKDRSKSLFLFGGRRGTFINLVCRYGGWVEKTDDRLPDRRLDGQKHSTIPGRKRYDHPSVSRFVAKLSRTLDLLVRP